MSKCELSSVRFFGYWSGIVPEIAELHFRSFLFHHPDSCYDLWLDEDTSSGLCQQLDWLNVHPQIHVHYFSLYQLIRTYIKSPEHLFKKNNIFKMLIRRLHRRKLFCSLDITSFNSSIFGVSYKHSSPFYVSELNDSTYRADIARCLIPMHEFDAGSIYADLDVCFIKNMLDLCTLNGFVYRWENLNFANNAIIYCPNRELSGRIIMKGNEIESFRPCFLFENGICSELGIQIFTAELFDPLWNRHSVMFNNGDLFFKDTKYSATIIDELFNGKYFAVHWHNRWQAIAENNSPYELLLAAYSNSESAIKGFSTYSGGQ